MKTRRPKHRTERGGPSPFCIKLVRDGRVYAPNGDSPRRVHACHRSGMASLEVVMATAVMLPVAGILLFLGIKMSATIYQAIGALVAWPFL